MDNEIKKLKEKVGITDVALSLNYKINRSAGVHKYVELFLPDGRGGHSDTIVVKHPNDKLSQKYFRRSCNELHDVVDFIKENINQFSVEGKNDFEKAKKVLRQFANEPVELSEESKYLAKATENIKPFDKTRYEVEPVTSHPDLLKRILVQRGFDETAWKVFEPFMVQIKDMESQNKYANLGFPYTKPGSVEPVGYEICGMNHYKQKAQGTNSTSAAWIADFSDGLKPNEVRAVYFFESSFDAMAFAKLNRVRLQHENPVLVSLGGTFSDQQVSSIMKYYSEALAIDCFDNDRAGRVAGIRMAGLMNGFHPNIVTTNDLVMVNWHGQEVKLPAETASILTLAEQVNVSGERVGQWKPAAGFKDWNDQLLNKPMSALSMPNKFQRNEHLAQLRAEKSGAQYGGLKR